MLQCIQVYTMSSRTRKIAALLLSLSMAACGGGGGSSTVASSTPTAANGTDATNTPASTPTTPASTPAGTSSPGNTSSSNSGSTGTAPADTGSATPPPVASGTGSGGSSSSSSTSTSQSGDAGTGTPVSGFKLDENARFTDPSDLVLDSAGNLYVMDRGERNIRRVAATGEVSTVSGGWDAGSRLAIDAVNNLFILSGTEIWKLTQNGTSTPDKVVYASYPPSPGSSHPVQIALDALGRLYVLQQYRNDFTVDRVDTDRLTHIHPYTYTEFGGTFDMAGDAQGNLAVGRIGPTGSGSVTWVPQSLQPATDTTAGLVKAPIALNSFGKMVLDNSGNVYIADMTTSTSSDNKTVATGMRVIKLAQDGSVTPLLSGFPSGQNGLSRQLPTAYHTNIGLAVSQAGDVYVSVPTDQAVYKISSPGVATLYAGKPAQPGVTVSGAAVSN